jgi:hypothetical protein
MFTVARVWVSGTTLEVQQHGLNLYNKDRRSHDRLILKYGDMDRVSGGVLSALGVLGGIQSDAGSWYVANTPYTTSAQTTFFVWYKHEAGAWTSTAALSLFSEEITGGHAIYETYQNGTDLTALSGSNYGVYWVYLCPEGNLYIALGTSSYANVGLAQAATVPTPPPYMTNWGGLIGRVITKKGTVPLYSVESAFSTQFTLSAAVDHASLANLTAADSHPQAAITGLTTADGPSFDHLHLTVAIGTAPLVVTSTTVCPNLNSDLFDGYHASSFVLATAGIISNPPSTGYRIKNLYLNASKHIVVVYDETPIP